MKQKSELVDAVSRTLRLAFRSVRRTPGFTASIIAILGLGIGANAVMFAVVDRLLLSPPRHVVDAEKVRLLHVRRKPSNPQIRVIQEIASFRAITYPDYQDLLGVDAFTDVALYSQTTERTVGRGAAASRARVVGATANLFPLLGVQPALGRFFRDREDALAANPTEATARHRSGRAEEVALGRYDADADVLVAPIIAARGPSPSSETRVARWLAGVSLVVLLIACLNVANLLLARSIRTRREIAVRLAVGASRRRLIGELLTESLMFATMGAGGALLVARVLGDAVHGILLPDVAFADAGPGGRLLGFTLVTTLATGLFSGLIPALLASKAELTDALRAGGRGVAGGRSKTRNILLVGQVALSVALLVGAGLFVRSLRAARDEARADREEEANRLSEAARTIRDNKLEERVRYSRGLIGIADREYASEFEAETTRIAEELQEELQSASGAGQPAPGGEETVEEVMRARRAEAAEAGRAPQAEPQEIRPQDRAALELGPVFTPMTVRPEITNRAEVVAALLREYPPELRDAGTSGTVVVWFYLTETGQNIDSRVSRSSGQEAFDRAALRLARVFRFTPARRGSDPVPVWIEVPITFQAQ